MLRAYYLIYILCYRAAMIVLNIVTVHGSIVFVLIKVDEIQSIFFKKINWKEKLTFYLFF